MTIEMNKEIEVRYRLSDGEKEAVFVALKRSGWVPVHTIQNDTYFCAKEYKDSGKTKDCPYVVRLRTSDRHSTLTYKSFQGGGGSSWIELETGVENPEVLKQILVHLKQESYLEIKKDRLSGKIDNIEINLDTIEKLGNFAELEIITNEEESGREKLVSFAEQLGLSRNNAVTVGYVQLMEQLNALL